METPKTPQPIPPPPGVVNAIRAGMDVISNHLSVLLLPLALDLLLWFGPRLSIKNVLIQSFARAMDLYTINGMANETQVKQMMAVQEIMTDYFQKFNLFSTLRTFPVGVSSLLQGKMPSGNPLGNLSVMEIPSVTVLFGLVFLFMLIGWTLGGLYFNWVSTLTGIREKNQGSGRAITQTILFSLLLTVLTFIVGIPVLSFLALIGLFGTIGSYLLQAAIFVLALFSAWIIVPIFFAPHGIYLRGQNAFYSIYTSLRMARFTMPSSSMFVLAVFIISQGLNYLWAVPSEDTWMMLVGIIGHAFITSALLAASFIYYRDMNAWLEIVFQRLKPGTAAPQI